jgi:hypothetical protein
MGQVDVALGEVHQLLFPHSGHEERFEEHPFLFIAGFEKCIHCLVLVDLWFLLDVAGPIVLVNDAADTLGLKEGHNNLELVVNTPGGLLFVAEKGGVLEKISPIDLLDRLLLAGLGEIIQSRFVRGVGLGLLG